jgi:hypothetical protein
VTPTIAPWVLGSRTEPEPADADREVDRGERAPATLALQDAGLPAHHGEGYDRRCDQGRDAPGVQVERGGDERRRQQHDDAEREGGGVAGRHHLVLDLRAVLRVGADPSRTGGLEAEREHVEDEQKSHHRREGAVLRGPENPGGEDREAVGGDVHDRHRDGDGRAVAQGLAARRA